MRKTGLYLLGLAVLLAACEPPENTAVPGATSATESSQTESTEQAREEAEESYDDCG